MNTGPGRGGSVAAPLVGAQIIAAAPTAADKPASTAAQPAPNRFAELLRRNRAEAPKPAAPAPAHAPCDDSAGTDGTDTGDTSAIEATAAPANAAKARAATAKDTSAKPVVHDSLHGSEKAEAAAGGSDADQGDGSERGEHRTASPSADRIDSRAAAQVAVDTLHRLASAGSAADSAPVDTAAGSTGKNRDASTPAEATRVGLGHARGMATVDAATDRRASLVDAGREAALRVDTDARFLVAADEALPSSNGSAAGPAHTHALDALTASPGLGAPSPGVDTAAAASPSAALVLPTPIDSPDFAGALGVRVSLLVQDGVQQAELHLNPAETGPVSIHITLDGTAARVDFGADVAATRAAIERGLPELASALRDAGFTLAGGGVSQHSGGRAGSDGAGPATRTVDAGVAPVSTTLASDSQAVRRTVASGGVDLYA